MKPKDPSNLATTKELKFIEPMYARLNKLPEGKEWLYEVKLDGYRCLAGKGKHLPCLKSNTAGPFDYYVIPEILHWEDRATEWSGLPDKIEVKIIVYDGGTGNEVASTLISGQSKWATFGGDHPQDLLPEPLNNYVESLY